VQKSILELKNGFFDVFDEKLLKSVQRTLYILQFILADMAMNIEAARQLTYAAAAKSERNDKDLRFFSSASKTFASDVAMKVTTDAVQVLGGYGYVSDYPVERMMRDAKLTQIYEGTNQVQRIVMARNLP
jgi:alkylation response protein AidB-like acyl-CoA dehydrogenase